MKPGHHLKHPNPIFRPRHGMRHRALLLSLALLLGLSVLLGACRASAPPEGTGALRRAHAHNDYEHTRPLYDALDHGFTSVEADVHLVGGQLLVAHDPEDVEEDKTLQALYLDPLRERTQAHDGWVFPDRSQLTLLIDVKTEAESTYQALEQALEGYADILTVFEDGKRQDGAVVVVLSGNRARETMAQDEVRYTAYDGRMEDLTSGAPSTLIPLISDKWTDHFFWRGDGDISEGEWEKLTNIVDQAHADGRRVRFWATPDARGPQREKVWQTLVEADVDLINTDDLEALQQFLLEHDS
ncbi:MAG: phosphatidylinositol-specific phospholipase C/glycerophosphodiester phosphodiesterase family protein [Anaerolineae bacterium]